MAPWSGRRVSMKCCRFGPSIHMAARNTMDIVTAIFHASDALMVLKNYPSIFSELCNLMFNKF